MAGKYRDRILLLIACMLGAVLVLGIWTDEGMLRHEDASPKGAATHQQQLAERPYADGGSAAGAAAPSGEQATSAQADADVAPAAQNSAPTSFVMPEDVAYEPDVVLLEVADGVSADEVNALLASTGAVDGAVAEGAADGIVKLTVSEGTSVEDAVNALMASSIVENAQPNYYYYAMHDEQDLREMLPDVLDTPADPQVETTAEPEADSQDEPADDSPAEPEPEPEPEPASAEQASEEEPQANPSDLMEALAVSIDDPLASSQWALASLNAYDAWALARCEGAVTVAVLDDYPDVSHPDLASNTSYYDAYASTTYPTELRAHGTHVTGIVAAAVNNGIGVAGLSYNAHVLAINVFNGTVVDSYSVVQAYELVMDSADKLNVRVVNLSFGGASSTDSFVDTGIIGCVNKAFKEYGIVTVAAAGNISSGTEPYYEYPGDADKIVSVINLKQNGSGVARNSNSNYNVEGQTAKNISAPGTLIRSTVVDGDYGVLSGTSMAAPQVSSILALEFAANPDLSAEEAVDILYATAADIGDDGFDREYGWGEADAYAAVLAAKTGEYDASAVHDLETPVPKAKGATRIPVGATATYEVTNGSLALKAGSAATLKGTTLTGVSEGTVTLALFDINGKERSTMTVSVYDTAGQWTLASAYDQSLVLDVAGGSLANQGNVQLYPSNGSRAQAWLLERQGTSGFYVRSAKTGKVLDVVGGSKANGANVQQYRGNGTVAQRWAMSVDAANRVSLINAGSGFALGAAGTTAARATNVCQSSRNGTAQKWVLKQTSIEVGPIWEGIYRVSSRVNDGFALEVKGASKANGANVQLYKANGSDAQRWKFEYQGDGVYKVSNLVSGKVLDVAGGKLVAGANIQQYSWNGTSAQRWLLTAYEDGSYGLVREGTSWTLDVVGGKAASGSNVQQYKRNGTAAQRWYLTQY